MLYSRCVKPDLKSLTQDEIARLLIKQGHPAYRSQQVVQWAYERAAESFDAMSNLSLELRQWLAAEFDLWTVKELREQHSTDTTEKFLFQLRDGALIETVLIPATPGLTSTSDRNTVCLSTQVGCAYGCKFCASGLAGVRRNLTAAEIVDQVVQVGRLTGERVSNLVVMGMGEPLANYDNVLRALRILNAPWATGIGARKITISTCGLVPGLRRLAQEPLQIRLAVSLHGATDEVRGQVMPVNQKFPLADLLAACEDYAKAKGKMLTFEYLLIQNVNDGLEQARKLAGIARRCHAKVNLIPYNPVAGLGWVRPDRERCKMFEHVVRQAGIATTLRLEKGTDINAACGQLRLQHERPAV